MPQRRRRVFFIGYKKGTKGYKTIAKDLDKHIYRLRKKMKDTFGNENFIVNTNSGYSID